ncbi:hypothetical protein RSP03_07380 [Cereibacter sphaeroides]|nr:hypothetical protein RSP03_07380 [Cereibacter sphaeroides]
MTNVRGEARGGGYIRFDEYNTRGLHSSRTGLDAAGFSRALTMAATSDGIGQTRLRIPQGSAGAADLSLLRKAAKLHGIGQTRPFTRPKGPKCISVEAQGAAFTRLRGRHSRPPCPMSAAKTQRRR